MYSIGACTHCFRVEVIGPGRDACLVCGKPFSHRLPLEELAPAYVPDLPPAVEEELEIPEELEFRGPCPYCTGPLIARITETSYAIEADVAAAAAGANGAGEGGPEPATETPPPAGEPDDVPETPAEPETVSQAP